jgi:hypothetical protein
LSSGNEISGASLRLSPGAIVRGKDGARPRILVPASGVPITVDNVRFENVDFIWRVRAEQIISPDRHVIIDLRAAHVEFTGCTFQAVASGSFDPPPAIRISQPGQRGTSLPPASLVKIERSVFQGVACGIDCRTRGPLRIDITSTLHMGQGALVRFPQTRPADAPASIALDHVTLRGADSVIELNSEEAHETSGTIALTTTACVLAPDVAGALAVLTANRKPASKNDALSALEWTGQGTLTGRETVVALWRKTGSEATEETLPDGELSLEGLVASPLEFNGPASSDPGASRLKRWLGPSQSDQMPGIGDNLPSLRGVN